MVPATELQIPCRMVAGVEHEISGGYAIFVIVITFIGSEAHIHRIRSYV